jgi:hypothetical protein
MSTNGSRPEENTFIVDGLTNDNPYQGLTIINGPGVAGDAATILPIDAIQELHIEENPSAEYGGKAGGVVNVGIKSGTNSLHGTAYAFGRDTAFDARNYFNPPPYTKQSVALQQFGATVGGRIIKDKLFFFIGYEGERYTVSNSFSATVPEALAQSTPDPKNSFPDAISDMINNKDIQPSALSLTLAGCKLGPPISCTGGLFSTNSGNSTNITQGFPSLFGSDNGVVKIDYHINEHNVLNGMFFDSAGVVTAEDVVYLQPQWRSVQTNRPYVAGMSWTATPNSTWVNVARFGYILMNRGTKQVDANVAPSAYGIYTGVTAVGSLPIITVGSFTNLGGGPGWPTRFGPDSVYQFVDYVSYLHGNHVIKFGGDFRRNLANPSGQGGAKGSIRFSGSNGLGNALENFLAGDAFNGSIQSGNPERHLSQWYYAGSIEDDWRVTHKLTLNLGLRYEYSSPMSESNNLEAGFDPNLGLVQVGKQISSIYNPDRKDFSPRFGLAWDLSGKGTTVVRGGFGIIYNSLLPMGMYTGIAGNAPNASGGVSNVPTGATYLQTGAPPTVGTGTIAVANVKVSGGTISGNWQNNGPGTPIFPGANTVVCDGTINADGVPTAPCSIGVMDHNFKNPYVSSWTLGVQHALTTNISLDLSYIGSHGSRINGTRDINQPDPTTGTPVFQFQSKFPYLGPIIVMSNMYQSNYNGLQVTFGQRVSHGLSFNLGYTYSHSLDDDSYNEGQFLPQDSRFPQREYASSDFDITHRLTFSLTYLIPGKKSPAQLLEGWQLNSIVTLETGQPWYGNDQSDNISGTGEGTDRWDFFGHPKDFKSGNSSIPYCTGTGLTDGACTQTNPAVLASTSGTLFPLPAGQSQAYFASCVNAAAKVDGALMSGPTYDQLTSLGCYAQGSSVLIPPAAGTFGTSGRNIWRDSGLRDWDLSISKNWKLQERLSAQLRAEFFNILNHPNFANPYGASNGYGIGSKGDPSSTANFGCGCSTPDQAGGNPVLGSGGNRAMQLGLKFIF